MSRNSRELDKVERGFAKLVGPTKARALRKKLEKKIALAAKQGGSGKPAKTEAQAIKDLIRQKQAGWVKAEGAPKAVLVQAKTGCPILGFNGKEITINKPIYPGNTGFNMAAFAAHAGFFEGNVPWMYQDTKGNVTVAIGHLLADAAAAKQLFFVRRGTGIRASAAEIDRAFNTVTRARLGSNTKATAFKNLTQIELTAVEITNLFQNDVGVFQFEVRKPYKDFANYPEIAKRAIVDIAFTMGTPDFIRLFKIFRAAAQTRNWKLAAKESERSFKDKTTGKIITKLVQRNSVIRGWLMQAAQKEPFFLDKKCKNKPQL